MRGSKALPENHTPLNTARMMQSLMPPVSNSEALPNWLFAYPCCINCRVDGLRQQAADNNSSHPLFQMKVLILLLV
jgi:hypothetical protein